jgi:hypothetical protein
MNVVKSDRLLASVNTLRHALSAEGSADGRQWGEAVHGALGRVIDAIADEVHAAEQSLKDLGEINPDFQNSPVADRHVTATRDQLIRLREQVHQLRSEIRQLLEMHPLDLVQVRLRGEEIAAAIEKVRAANDKFLLATVNTNPGAGE